MSAEVISGREYQNPSNPLLEIAAEVLEITRDEVGGVGGDRSSDNWPVFIWE